MVSATGVSTNASSNSDLAWLDYSKRLAEKFQAQLFTLRKSTVRHDVEVEREIAELLPASAMKLKQATAFYAMYLSFEQRDRLFAELDFLLDPEGWDEDDNLPQSRSYLGFLKWAVETRECEWTSLSLDGDGHIVASYMGDNGVLSAAFLPNDLVQWASRVQTEDGLDVSAGHSPLRSFAAHSKALISRV